MTKLRLRIAMSLDGYVAGPRQSVDYPLGIGGNRLHEWVYPLKSWRAPHGLEGGEEGESNAVLEESQAHVGATIMGRNMFGGQPGKWQSKAPWDGWWGDNPPFHHHVFVITHFEREPLEKEGGTTFHFVTGGIREALEKAREAADGKNILLGGGANVANQYLAAGLVDEMLIHLVPILLGEGMRLFEGVRDDLHGLELVRSVGDRSVVHLKFAR